MEYLNLDSEEEQVIEIAAEHRKVSPEFLVLCELIETTQLDATESEIMLEALMKISSCEMKHPIKNIANKYRDESVYLGNKYYRDPVLERSL